MAPAHPSRCERDLQLVPNRMQKLPRRAWPMPPLSPLSPVLLPRSKRRHAVHPPNPRRPPTNFTGPPARIPPPRGSTVRSPSSAPQPEQSPAPFRRISPSIPFAFRFRSRLRLPHVLPLMPTLTSPPNRPFNPKPRASFVARRPEEPPATPRGTPTASHRDRPSTPAVARRPGHLSNPPHANRSIVCGWRPSVAKSRYESAIQSS
jgi:hypothetical protein